MNSKISASALFSLAVIGLSASAALAQERPQLYPNEYYKKVGAAQAGTDISLCEGEARTAVGSATQESTAVKKGVRTAAKGAALGALAGSINGNAGKGAGAGAAVGGTVGVVRGAREKGQTNPDYKNYVTACLESKGYKILSWK